MKKDSRGFKIYGEFEDSYGAQIYIKQSSSAEGNFCWIGVHGGSTLSQKQKKLYEECREKKFMMPGSEIINDSTSAHITPELAREIAEALLKFANGK